MDVIFNGDRAYRHLEVLTEDIGPRHGSSKNETKAARYIHGFFKELGLKTGYADYPVYSFETATAKLTTPDGPCFPCKPFPMTASTPAAGITAKTLFMEDAHAAFIDEQVTGRIVVSFNTFDRATHERFLIFKPAGLVAIQSAHSQLHVAAPWRSPPDRQTRTIPSVCMTYTDGLMLLEDRPETLTLTSQTTDEGWRIGKNVIADLPGSDPGDDIIVICAHYDSVWTGPGAFDNGGGTAALMELARVYKEKGSKYTLRFCAFGGEEMGLWGSKSYVQQLKDRKAKHVKGHAGKQSEINNIRFVINLDMMGMHFGRSNALILGHSDIAASVRLLANRHRYAIGIQEDKIYSSDNKFFNFMGIPSLSFNRVGFANGHGHTAGDTIDNCSPEGLAHISRFVEAWIDTYMMNLHTFPFPRELPPSSKKSVDDMLAGKDVFQGYDRNKLLKQAQKGT